MADYLTSHLQTLFDISPQTVRNWAMDFARYLSPSAAPGRGHNRQFTEDDLRVFSLIAGMKKNGATSEEIHVALVSGQRGELPNIAPNEIQALVMTDQARAVTTLKQQITLLQTQLESTLGELQNSRDENNQLRGKVQLLTEQLKASQEEVRKLDRENAKLESRLGG